MSVFRNAADSIQPAPDDRVREITPYVASGPALPIQRHRSKTFAQFIHSYTPSISFVAKEETSPGAAGPSAEPSPSAGPSAADSRQPPSGRTESRPSSQEASDAETAAGDVPPPAASGHSLDVEVRSALSDSAVPATKWTGRPRRTTSAVFARPRRLHDALAAEEIPQAISVDGTASDQDADVAVARIPLGPVAAGRPTGRNVEEEEEEEEMVQTQTQTQATAGQGVESPHVQRYVSVDAEDALSHRYSSQFASRPSLSFDRPSASRPFSGPGRPTPSSLYNVRYPPYGADSVRQRLQRRAVQFTGSKSFRVVVFLSLVIHLTALILWTQLHQGADIASPPTAVVVLLFISFLWMLCEILLRLAVLRWKWLRFFSSPWAVFDLVVFLSSVCLFSAIAMPSMGEDVSGSSTWRQVDGIGLVGTFLSLRLLKSLTLSTRSNRLLAFLGSAMAEIYWVLLIAVLVFVLFVCIGSLAFGPRVALFASFTDSALTLFLILFSHTLADILSATMAEYSLSWIFFLIYILVVYLLVLDLVLAMIVEAFHAFERRYLVEVKRALKAAHAKLEEEHEDALAAREMLEIILNSIPDPIYVKDEAMNLVLANAAFYRLGEHDGPPESTAKVLKEGGTVQTEEAFVDSDGRRHVIQAKKTRFEVEHEEGHVERFVVSVSRDVTDLRRFEQKLSMFMRQHPPHPPAAVPFSSRPP